MALVKASHRYARISATKVRPLADLVRDKTVEDALDALKFLPNRGARMLERVILSAQANASEVTGHVGGLRISEARVDGGPMVKRVRPRARGMAFIIRKRQCHIHVGIDIPEAN
ncbi:MAG: 50S ribosomal protein L22 [Planctomycetaceae bacterium]|jgi:large subunit ribosomal protein L22|nr:50S ribosomal protein L22 [Planctomycetaceae bacterium]